MHHAKYYDVFQFTLYMVTPYDPLVRCINAEVTGLVVEGALKEEQDAEEVIKTYLYNMFIECVNMNKPKGKLE